MKIAIAQLNPIIGDLAGNAQQILAAAHQAVARGASLMLTPELSLCGYPPRDLLLQPSFVQSLAAALVQLAHELPPQLAVLVGTVEPNPRSHQTGGKPLFNSTAFVQHGQVQQVFHKRLLPTYDVFDEDRYFSPGDQSTWFEMPCPSATENGTNGYLSKPMQTLRVGVTICEDLWNDEGFWGRRNYGVDPIGELAQQQVDLIVNLSASPFTVGKQQVREAMLHHAAVRYQLPILYANQVGGNDDLIFDGSSVGFDRQGNLVHRSRAFSTDLTVVEWDIERRDLLPCPEAIAPLPDSNAAEIWAALVLGVQDYVRKCGFSKVVLGLSGGIDSSLVAAIATAALGAEHVLGVLMPSPYSSDHSVNDALELAHNLGIQTHTLPIGELMKTYDHTFADLFAGTEFGIAEENIQSRIRGNLLMAVSNKFGHLLISTGNKSELAVGYCTLYGDMNGGLAAIADVPKTDVYRVCRWLNRMLQDPAQRSVVRGSEHFPAPSGAVIPPQVLSKPPSAELKPGQVDQDSLPSYDDLDDILDRLIHQHQSPAEMVAAGYDPEVVNQVITLVKRAEFKRKQAPPGLKITDRAFGTGWRMPIASRWRPLYSPTSTKPRPSDAIKALADS